MFPFLLYILIKHTCHVLLLLLTTVLGIETAKSTSDHSNPPSRVLIRLDSRPGCDLCPENGLGGGGFILVSGTGDHRTAAKGCALTSM